MARSAPKSLEFPLGGLHDGLSYRKQPPFTSPDLCNVRGFEPIEGRARGGQRPGLCRLYGKVLGGGQPVRLLTQGVASGLNWDSTLHVDYTYLFKDDFDRNSLGSNWEQTGFENDQPNLTDDPDDIDSYDDPVATALAVDHLETAKTARVGIYLEPYGGSFWGKHQIFAAMGSGLDWTSSGLQAEIELDGSNYTARLSRNGSLETEFPSGSDSIAYGGWFELEIEYPSGAGSAMVCTLYWHGTIVGQTTVSYLGGTRVGFGLNVDGDYPPALAMIDKFRMSGRTTAREVGEPAKSYLLASAGHDVYVETSPGDLELVTGASANLSDAHLLHGTGRGFKIYAADYDAARIVGADGVVSAGGNELTSATVTNWTEYDIDPDTDAVELTDVTGATEAGTYKIASVSAGKLVIDGDAGGSGTCGFRVERAPKVYNPSTDKMTIWTGTGSGSAPSGTSSRGDVPLGCHLICLYRDRMVLAQKDSEPRMWYMSRQGDPNDWDYSQTDAQAATAGNNSDAGRVGEAITALAPFGDDYLVFGCRSSVWALHGDPMLGGELSNISREVGVSSSGAWCSDANGNMYFMSMQGLFRLPYGAQRYPEPVSQEKLPRALSRVNPDLYEILLEWNPDEQSVHIFLTNKQGLEEDQHYVYDTRLDAFWKDKFTWQHSPTATLNYASEWADYRYMLVGGKDGLVRSFHPDSDTDDGQPVNSYVLYEPIRPGGSDLYDGLVLSLEAVIGQDSGNISWQLLSADSHEQAVKVETAQRSGTFGGEGYRYRDYPRLRGGSVCMRLSNAENQQWTIEKCIWKVRRGGRQRKL